MVVQMGHMPVAVDLVAAEAAEIMAAVAVAATQAEEVELPTAGVAEEVDLLIQALTQPIQPDFKPEMDKLFLLGKPINIL
jgi:hypothetical protein